MAEPPRKEPDSRTPTASRTPWVLPVLAAVAVSIPALTVGFTHDDLTHRLFLGVALLFYRPSTSAMKRLRVLSMAPHDQRLTRLGPSAFSLEVLGEPRRANDFGRLYRPDSSPLAPGQSYTAGELRAHVVETTQGLTRRVRFELDRSLDDSSVRLVAWRDRWVQPVAAPPLGLGRQPSVILLFEPGPMGL